ncbi:CHAD domain-containing protein [Thioclava nitratireducens]|uniref:CHAD domain-containing protein n=1 Tax=Thioclava nitratireducens TaxID=1915078 RepID=UPI002481744B|nr:CHAD domain-containing protein [Thioclava nitratireducens]WGT49111.1 CHAD domain-containing protein [Thioclava nitratireducens]
MVYAISPDDKTPTKALRRIARSELGTAIKLAGKPDPSVHALRKAIKKTRGLIRLFAPHFADFHKENETLFEAARGISGLRDDEVMRASLIRLGREGPDLDGASAARTMLEALPATPPPKEGDISTFVKRVTEIRKRAKDWEVSAKGWPAYETGLHETLKDCRKRLKTAQKSHAGADLHHWRTRVKQHWYHTRLLAPIWPEMLHPREDALDTLGELIGDHHDLHVLEMRVPEHLDPERAEALLALIRTESARLEAEAFTLGAKIFAEPPEPLCDRWGAWFELWKA